MATVTDCCSGLLGAAMSDCPTLPVYTSNLKSDKDKSIARKRPKRENNINFDRKMSIICEE